MSRNPLEEGWRYYGCARWGCDAVNPDYQSYGTKDGRSWCLHHRPGPMRRFVMAWTVFPCPPSRRCVAAMPMAVLTRTTKLPAIRTVLGAYRSEASVITEEQITAAWDEYDAVAFTAGETGA